MLPSRYLWTVLGTITVLLLVIAALNFSMDPFRVFGTPRRVGWNDHLPNTSGFDRMAKPYELLRVAPRTVLLGSSTAHSGFLPLSEWETPLPRPAYNYALLGASMHEVQTSLSHALRECPVEAVVLVADFFAFNAHYPDNERFEPVRLPAATHRGWPGFLGSDLAAFTIGRDALGLSWQTLVASRTTHTNGAPASSAAAGYPWLEHFRNCERSYLDKWFPPPSHAYEFAVPEAGLDRFADFDAALRGCAEHGVRLIVICPPIHARFHEALASAGAWPQYELWKRELALRTRRQQAQLASSGSIELWDFSLFNEATGEPLPALGAAPMRNFFDSAHFTPELGRRVLDEILGSAAPAGERLGVRLDRVEIDTHLATVRADLERYRSTHPETVADVRSALGLQRDRPATPLAAALAR